MHSSVRLQYRILASLALGLAFTTQNIGIYVYMLLHSPPSLQANLVMIAVHSSGMLGCGLLMPFLLARRKAFLSPLPLLLTLTVLLLLASHVPAWQSSMLTFSLRALCIGMLWPLALYAFCQITPPGSRGLLLGLLIAAAELIWLALLPAMHFLVPGLPDQAPLGFLYKLQIVVQCTIGLALAAFFTLNAEEDQSPPDVCEQDPAPFVLPLLFVAATLLYIAYGLTSGLSTPKVSRSVISENAHIALLFAMPVAGALVDRGGRTLLAVLPCLAFIAPAMLFTKGAKTQEALYIALYVGRQGVFLATLLLADRLIRNRKLLPLLFALAFTLVSVGALAGNAIARALEDVALKGGLAVCMVLAFALLLLRLRNALVDAPLTRDEDMLELDSQLLDQGSLAAFGKTYRLSRQEKVVMEMLAQRRSTEDIAKVMNVAEKTVRTYVSRILQKTKAPNRAAIIELLAATGLTPAAAAEQGESDSR